MKFFPLENVSKMPVYFGNSEAAEPFWCEIDTIMAGVMVPSKLLRDYDGKGYDSNNRRPPTKRENSLKIQDGRLRDETFVV